MNNTAMDFFLSSPVYVQFNSYTPTLTPLKSIMELLMVFGGIGLIVMYFTWWNKSGIKIMGQTYREACYTRPYVCENYRAGICNWCKVHDEREVHKLKQVFDLLMGFPEDAGLVDKGLEDHGIKRGLALNLLIMFILSVTLGELGWERTAAMLPFAANYISPQTAFVIKLTNSVGMFFTFFSVWFLGVWARYQFFRIEEYSKLKYGRNIWRTESIAPVAQSHESPPPTNGRQLKKGYFTPGCFPLTIVGLGLTGAGILYLASPSLFGSMVDVFTAFFRPTGGSLTTQEMQPIFSPNGNFTLAIVYGNFNNSFFLGLLGLLVLIVNPKSVKSWVEFFIILAVWVLLFIRGVIG